MTRVRVQLNDCAHAFLPGHRLQLAVSTNYWPMVWPSPEPVRLTVHGGSTLELPVRPPRHEDDGLRDLGEPEWGPLAAVTVLREGRYARETRIDALTGETSVTNVVEGPLSRLDQTGRALALTGYDRSSIGADDPATARAESRREFEIVRDGLTIRVSADVVLACTREDLLLDVRMTASEDDATTWDRDWSFRIPRDRV